MSKLASTLKPDSPASFQQHNHTIFQRTVALTQKAITHLEVEGRTVTLAAVCEATAHFDDRGKSLAPITILRNPEAAALFRQSSPAYQARQQQAKKAKRKRKVSADSRGIYRGLHSTDLIKMVEELKVQMAEMKTRATKLRQDRDEACRLRDEALRQNVIQLATLTKLTEQVRSSNLKTTL